MDMGVQFGYEHLCPNGHGCEHPFSPSRLIGKETIANMSRHANGFVSMLMNVTFHAKVLNERDKSKNECRFKKNERIFALMSSRPVLMIICFLVMNSKKCNVVIS